MTNTPQAHHTHQQGGVGSSPGAGRVEPASVRTIHPGPDDEFPVRVEDYGSGRPVVFIHGLVGLNKHWRDAVDAIAHRSRCLLFEAPLLSMRGPNCTVEGVAGLLGEAIASVVDEPAVIVGSSFGGHVALRIVLDHPERAAGLVLVGSSGLYEEPYEEEIEQVVKKDVQHRPSRSWMDKKITELFFDRAKMPPGIVDEAFAELSQRRAARAMVKLSKSSRRDHMGDRLHAITAPTLVLWGRQDIVTPPRVAEELCSLLPDARLRWIDQCGHAPMIEQPQAFNAALIAFLDELWSDDAEARSASRQVVV